MLLSKRTLGTGNLCYSGNLIMDFTWIMWFALGWAGDGKSNPCHREAKETLIFFVNYVRQVVYGFFI